MLHKPLRCGIALRMEKKDVRIQLVIGPSEVAALDQWRAKHQIWSRSDAIRRLIAQGIKEEGEGSQAAQPPPEKP